jgi:hypothetical protein
MKNIIKPEKNLNNIVKHSNFLGPFFLSLINEKHTYFSELLK